MPGSGSVSALELSRARAAALLRRDQEVLSQRDHAEKVKAAQRMELIARRKEYGKAGGKGGKQGGSRQQLQGVPTATPSTESARSTASEEVATRPASPIAAKKQKEQQPAGSEAMPLFGGLFERAHYTEQPRHSLSGWRCHALAETPRASAPAPTAPGVDSSRSEQSQQIAAMAEQLEALTACLRQEQAARREAEEALKISQQQVAALSHPLPRRR